MKLKANPTWFHFYHIQPIPGIGWPSVLRRQLEIQPTFEVWIQEVTCPKHNFITVSPQNTMKIKYQLKLLFDLPGIQIFCPYNGKEFSERNDRVSVTRMCTCDPWSECRLGHMSNNTSVTFWHENFITILFGHRGTKPWQFVFLAFMVEVMQEPPKMVCN